MDKQEYTNKLRRKAWRMIDYAHEVADPMIHERALNLFRKADMVDELR